jgi:hypothetical protein
MFSLGAGGLSCSLRKFHVWPKKKIGAFIDQKVKNCCQILEFMYINNQDSDPGSPKSLNPDQVSDFGSETLSTGI